MHTEDNKNSVYKCRAIARQQLHYGRLLLFEIYVRAILKLKQLSVVRMVLFERVKYLRISYSITHIMYKELFCDK